MSALRRYLASFARATGGNAAVEFAILVPILLLLVAGTVDLGLGFQRKLEMQSALNSGLQHAMQTQGSDIATTRAVITHGLTKLGNFDLDANSFCRCANGDASCTTTCQPGLDRFAKAIVTMPYKTPLFDLDMELSASFELFVGKVQ